MFKEPSSENLRKLGVSVSQKSVYTLDYSYKDSLYISQKYSVSEIIAQSILSRINDIEDIPAFLRPSLREQMVNVDPFTLFDIDKALERIIHAIKNREQVAVFGDYDVDGATSTALMIRYFRKLGMDILYHIPDRLTEGYGPNPKAMENFQKCGAKLCITVDCGTVANEVLEGAMDKGLDIIIIDHHISTENIPKVCAVINPNRIDETACQDLRNMAAVGVSFMVLVALNSRLRQMGFFEEMGITEPNLIEFLDLVAIGTVCDVMSLSGLNRALVKQGIKIINRRSNPGLKAMFDLLNLDEKIESYHIGFIIGPRINAGGRVGTSSFGAKMLSCDDYYKAYEYAEKLNEFNIQRKQMEAKALEEATEISSTDKNEVIIVYGQWHQGIIGILASRLKDLYNKPVIIITDEGEGKGKASGRSIVGIDLGNLVLKAKEKGIILEGGGHAMAAGFSVKIEKIDEVRKFFNEEVQKTELSSESRMIIDGVIGVGAINFRLFNQFKMLEPFGCHNPTPRVLIEKAYIINASIVGENHVRCILGSPDTKRKIKSIGFNIAHTDVGQTILNCKYGEHISVIGRITINRWNDQENIQINIEDIVIDTIPTTNREIVSNRQDVRSER